MMNTAKHWMIDPKYGDFGVELYCRMSRDQRIQYSAYIAKARSAQHAAMAIDSIHGTDPTNTEPLSPSTEAWVIYHQNIEQSRKLLNSSMTRCERDLVLAMDEDANASSLPMQLPDCKSEVAVILRPELHMIWSKNDRQSLVKKNQELEHEFGDVIQKICG